MKNLREHGIPTDHRVYCIAEIGINHGGKMALAFDLIDSAAAAGADAVKFQTYRTETRTFPGSPIFDILKQCELPFGAFDELKRHAERAGVDFFSTPFDEESVDYLDALKVPVYKIASFDVVNRPFLAKVASKARPVILSVGMADIREVQEAVRILQEGTPHVSLLHCVSSYPMNEEDANLSAIRTLQENFDGVVGYSDHTNDVEVPLYAAAAGAQIIEKHYRISEAMDCVDAPVSVTEEQMKRLVEGLRRIERILGTGEVAMTEAQKGAAVFRRDVAHAGKDNG